MLLHRGAHRDGAPGRTVAGPLRPRRLPDGVPRDGGATRPLVRRAPSYPPARPVVRRARLDRPRQLPRLVASGTRRTAASSAATARGRGTGDLARKQPPSRWLDCQPNIGSSSMTASVAVPASKYTSGRSPPPGSAAPPHHVPERPAVVLERVGGHCRKVAGTKTAPARRANARSSARYSWDANDTADDATLGDDAKVLLQRLAERPRTAFLKPSRIPGNLRRRRRGVAKHAREAARLPVTVHWWAAAVARAKFGWAAAWSAGRTRRATGASSGSPAA